jgi:hypothetical protein
MYEFLVSMGRFNLAYIIGQIILLPIYSLYLIFNARSLKLKYRLIIHEILMIGSLVLPFIMILEFKPLFGLLEKVFLTALIFPIKNNFFSNHFQSLPWYAFPGIFNFIGLSIFLFQVIKQRRTEFAIQYHCKIKKIGRIKLIVSHQIISSFSTGFFKHAIYLPLRLRSRYLERSIVIRHEAFHIRKKHVLKNLIEIVYKYCFWFNPLIHLMNQYGRQLRDELCDRSISSKFTPGIYSRFLVNEAEQYLNFRDTISANAVDNHGSSFQKRILNIWDINL